MELPYTWWCEEWTKVPWNGMPWLVFLYCSTMSSLQLYSVLLLVNLYQVSMIGVNFEDNHIATGLGNHLARPILRDEWHENLTFEEGVKLLEKCMRVLLYRDRSAVNKIQVFFFPLFLLESIFPNPVLPSA